LYRYAVGNNAENVITEYQSFTDLTYSKAGGYTQVESSS
jgi:hypothetical protein